MILIPEPEIKRLAARILLVQAAVTLIIAVLCWSIWGVRHGGSALVGGAIGTVANLYMTVATLRMSSSAGGALGRMMLGQFIKIGFTVAALVIVARTGKAAWPPLLVAYIATLLAFWAVGLRNQSTMMRPPVRPVDKNELGEG